MIFTVFIFYKTFTIFIIGFDKILLILNVIYLIVSYNFISIYLEELKKSIYNPSFELGSLFVDEYYDVEVELYDISKGKTLKGKLVNFDEASLIVYSEETLINGEVKVVLKYKRHVFTCIGKVVTRHDNGIGIRIIKDNKEHELDWSEFYKVQFNRGFAQ